MISKAICENLRLRKLGYKKTFHRNIAPKDIIKELKAFTEKFMEPFNLVPPGLILISGKVRIWDDLYVEL